ncbi:hypothetical protein HYW75_02470 [Candidatus Pacearchaeota archaeon]|nr:hypothetical protein [Candidatus Pacearchaeota archaeon]
MAIAQLERLAVEEREEFILLAYKRPFQMTHLESKRWEYFKSKIDEDKYRFEKRNEEARKPNHMLCTIVTRNPCIIHTNYGKFEVPEKMIPTEVRNCPDPDFYEDTIFADVAVDLEKRLIISFKFKGYLEMMKPGELEDFWNRCRGLPSDGSFESL